MVVRSLKKDAEEYLNEEVTEAVISVPAYFSDAQRKATKRVGELAGVKVERIISEPTAAAIAYGIAQKDADTRFLVFDLGGGTFDISILELFDSIMEVRAVAGDNYLGGEDFTKLLSDIFLEKSGKKEEELTKAECSMLYKKAESAKIAGGQMMTIELKCGEEVLTQSISEHEYEAKCKTLLSRLREPVERALADMTDETPFTRAEAAAAINGLLELDSAGLANAPYFPDVSPSMENYAAVELAGQSGTISWLSGDTAQPGFLNLDGHLYCVGEDGYFLRDTMVGTLYFDISGRYTSGDDALDSFVADLVDSQTNASMTREEMLRAVYDYVRDHYLYLKRNLYEVGETGWEIPEALLMFQSGKGNCYNFTAAFWSLARGIGFDAVCYSGLVGVGRDPHSWVEITFDGVPYVFDVETEMSYRLVNDYITSMYRKTYEEVAAWSYVRTPEEAAAAQEASE